MVINNKEDAHDAIGEYSERQIVITLLDTLTLKEMKKLIFKLNKEWN